MKIFVLILALATLTACAPREDWGRLSLAVGYQLRK